MKLPKKIFNIKIFTILALTIVSLQLILLKTGYFSNDADNKEYAEIQHPLEDKKTIKDGVVVDNKKDKKDITEKVFEKNTKKQKKISKKNKDNYYTIGDMVQVPNRLKPVKIQAPPKGMDIDNIDLTPDYINNNGLNEPFKDYVVFYPQHQDDEVLWAGSVIRDAINRRGASHVFIALVSSGTGHKMFKTEQFKGMSDIEKAEYRNREFISSCLSLGIPKENIIFIYKKRDDWKTDFNLEKEFAIEMENKYKSVTHFTHSYKYDDHFMHRANGETLYKLWQNGQIKDLRFYLKPFLVKYVDASTNTLNIYSASSKTDYDMIRRACQAYKYTNVEKRRAGIGYKTDGLSFNSLVYDKNEKSYVIIQSNKTKG
ncbi:hypothetical protein [Peptostreptococcus equinus]|uniref:PIG-L family deacetylase n=1 Tax=Peptostreptococcus equinus TaxID=3003601 RepID=A0ABY7JPN1_9FIRM|nr:hypothetical protein [Peptostreptococcus sp. CBA3647]WAW14446.1 hypothetical protein O0R46_07540 [Peptostreptococcus sp. CBA3647]